MPDKAYGRQHLQFEAYDHNPLRSDLSGPHDGTQAGVSEKGLDAASAEQAEQRETILIQLFLIGDKAAFQELFQRESQPVFRFIRRYTRSQEMAEDAFQETWARVWAHRRTFRMPFDFRKWLFQIARNTTFRLLKQNSQQMKISLYGTIEEEYVQWKQVQVREKGPREMMKIMQWREAFDDEMKLLEPLDQEILLMRFGSELKVKEIAEVLEIPASTVSTKLNRALEKIRKSLMHKGIDYPL